MNNRPENQRLSKVALAAKPWAFLIGVLLILKVTGAGSTISDLAKTALMTTGALDVDPKNTVVKDPIFDYDFSVTDLNGKTLQMRDLKGKVIFLNLWATWCGPCRVEMPSIQKLYDSVDKENVVFVMLSLDQANQTAKIRQYVSEKQFSFPVYQPASSLPSLLRVKMIPSTFIVAPDGTVRTKKSGMANYDTDEMKQFLQELASAKTE
jgi:thiol-disulfide isomerase/thioredoxin